MLSHFNRGHPVRPGIQLVLKFSQLQDEILGLIFSNLSPATTGDKGLQGTPRSFQVIYVALVLGIQILELVFTFPTL